MSLSNMSELNCCKWAISNPLLKKYHDEEWGVPVRDDNKLFEFLVLDAFQAGLSWLTILKKRENFRAAFAGFDAKKISLFTDQDVNLLLNNQGIIRNKLKIEATIRNAASFLEIQAKYGSFEKYIWQFTDGKTIQNSWVDYKQIPVSTQESDAMSKNLKKNGFNFVGTTICYAFMQAAGMVNDHETGCYRYSELR